MIFAVMSNCLNSIMLSLKDAIDSQQNIINIKAVEEAVGSLEVYPMSMTQLQDSRIALLLQTIRHKVDDALQKRIRFVIKAWQKLINPVFADSCVIPAEIIKSSDSVKEKPPHNQTKNVSQHRKRSYSQLTSPKNEINSTPPAAVGAKPSNDIQKTSSDNISAKIQKSDTHAKISKVKSTAELLKSASDCLDSATMDKILSNKIQKESDESPLNHSRHNQINNRNHTPLGGRKHSSSNSTNDNNAKAKNSPLISSDHQNEKENNGLVSNRHTLNSVRANDKLINREFSQNSINHGQLSQDEKNHSLSQNITNLNSTECQNNLTTSPKNQIEQPGIDDKKHKSKHKKKKKRELPPITNRLNQWPELPPMTANIDWNSLDKDCPSNEFIDSKGLVKIHSVPLNNRTMHILPWVDTFDEKKTFFPPQIDEYLDRCLDDISNPW